MWNLNAVLHTERETERCLLCRVSESVYAYTLSDYPCWVCVCVCVCVCVYVSWVDSITLIWAYRLIFPSLFTTQSYLSSHFKQSECLAVMLKSLWVSKKNTLINSSEFYWCFLSGCRCISGIQTWMKTSQKRHNFFRRAWLEQTGFWNERMLLFRNRSWQTKMS